MDEVPENRLGVTAYRGIFITRHPPMIFRDQGAKKLSLITCSFSVGGVAMAAESMAKARKLIDEALGPQS